MLNLPTITLVIIDNLDRKRAEHAVNKCLACAEFGAVQRIYDVPIRDKSEYSVFVLRRLHEFVATQHCLLIQWDGFIVNPQAWNPEFLSYDYIGAPWWWDHDHNVGNGGFSLRSAKMLKATTDQHLQPAHPEDAAIRENKVYLETVHGIKIAPESLAAQFSWEENPKYPRYAGAFGFHGKTPNQTFL